MAKIDDLLQKYSGKVTPATIKKLYDGDITPTKKYSEYMVKLWISSRKSNSKPTTVTTLLSYIKKFDELLPYIENKDIYSSNYKNWYDLTTCIEHAEKIREERTFVREENADVLYEDENVLFLVPKTYKGSLKYGANTRWCTASKSNAYTFTNYKKSGELFYLIRKKPNNNKWDKVAFNIRSGEHGPLFNVIHCFCSEDRSTTTNDILKSDWDLTFMITIRNLMTTYMVFQHNKRKNEELLKKEILKIKSIDIEHITNLIEKVNNGITKESQDLLSTLKESVVRINKSIEEKII